MTQTTATVEERSVQVAAHRAMLQGSLRLPQAARGVVVFAHGSGSGRRSPRNRFVAEHLNQAGLATLLLDLLTTEEEARDQSNAKLRFDMALLAERLIHATDWLAQECATAELPVGYFGASTGAGAALVAAAQQPNRIAAIVSRGGRPDLAGDALRMVKVPTLLIVGGNDGAVISLNQGAVTRLEAQTKQLVIVPGATHLFEESGTLDEVARLAGEWFARYLVPSSRSPKGVTPA